MGDSWDPDTASQAELLRQVEAYLDSVRACTQYIHAVRRARKEEERRLRGAAERQGLEGAGRVAEAGSGA